MTELVQKLDRQNMLGSLREFPDQIEQAWQEARRTSVPASYRSVTHIVVAGLGGSAFPADITNDLFQSQLQVPLTIVQEYSLPKYVDRNTLVLASSYSGTTEETLSALREARRRGARCLILTSGGQLARLAKQWSIPAYVFTPTHNPSGQPRMGTGYMLFGMIGLFAAARLIRVRNEDVDAVVRRIRQAAPRWSESTPFAKNHAAQLAREMKTRVPLIIGSEHFVHTALAFRNRLHENGKHYAEYFSIPALNHHLMEGLAHPKQRLLAVLLRSERYSTRIQRRFEITKRVLARHGIPAVNVQFRAGTQLEELGLHLAFSGYVSFWLAMEHGIDPSPIPWVDYFKQQLAKP